MRARLGRIGAGGRRKKIDIRSVRFHLCPMGATLTIPDLDEAVAQKLRAWASSHGRSVEAEVRDILIRAVTEAGTRPAMRAVKSERQPFLDLAGSVDGAPDLGGKRGFVA